MKCKQCGSFAINHHLHGRDGSEPDLCDVCFWRVRSDSLATKLAELRAKAEAGVAPVALRYQRNDEIWTHVYYSQASCEYLSKKGIRYELLYTAPPAQAVSLTTPTLNASCVPEKGHDE